MSQVRLHKIKSPAVMYASMIPVIQDICRLYGYCCAMHGSMARDLDVVAVPWVDDAQSPDVLVMGIAAETGGRLENYFAEREGDEIQQYPVKLPHGRLAWRISFAAERYIDVSVMPRIQ